VQASALLKRSGRSDQSRNRQPRQRKASFLEREARHGAGSFPSVSEVPFRCTYGRDSLVLDRKLGVLEIEFHRRQKLRRARFSTAASKTATGSSAIMFRIRSMEKRKDGAPRPVLVTISAPLIARSRKAQASVVCYLGSRHTNINRFPEGPRDRACLFCRKEERQLTLFPSSHLDHDPECAFPTGRSPPDRKAGDTFPRWPGRRSNRHRSSIRLPAELMHHWQVDKLMPPLFSDRPSTAGGL